eukprot:g23064.t1
MPEHQEHSPEELSSHGKEVLRAKQKVDKMDDGAPMGLTSAGCKCDPQAKCALQGRSFTWCRIGGGTCSLLSSKAQKEHPLDPALHDHGLYKPGGPEATKERDLDRSGAVWDYCEPHLGLSSGAAPRTAHGAMCARYMEDPFFLKQDGTLDLTKNGTFVVLAEQKDPEHQHLCTITDSSGMFRVCPTTVDDERPELAGMGWNASHSWDFCGERFGEDNWKPATTETSAEPPEELRLGDIEEPIGYMVPPVPAASAQDVPGLDFTLTKMVHLFQH